MNAWQIILLTVFLLSVIALVLLRGTHLVRLVGHAWGMRRWARRKGMRFSVFAEESCKSLVRTVLAEPDATPLRVASYVDGRLNCADVQICTAINRPTGADLRLQPSNVVRYRTFVCRVADNTPVRLAVRPREYWNQLGGRPFGETMRTELDAFNQRYEIRTDDPREASAILTPRIIAAIVTEDGWALDIVGNRWVAWTGQLLTGDQCEHAIEWLSSMESLLPTYLLEDAARAELTHA